MMNILRLILCIVLLFAAETGLPVSAEDFSARIRYLNGANNILPGSVYTLSGNRLEWVLDLLGPRPLDEAGGWLNHRVDPDRPAAARRLGSITLRQGHCNCLRPSDFWILPGDATTIQLGDPFECLEIVNRPLSNLLYNRNAEIRIMQWRTALAGAIQRRRTPGECVVLCTVVETMERGFFVARAGADSAQVERLWGSCSERRDGAASSGSESNAVRTENGYLYLPVGPLTMSASFRELELVEESTAPRIGFKFGKTILKSIAGY
ncbi:MAG: hypothetical protein JNM18_23490 [Planctomycetaceae bacterium]|nr:hypothetical protein [Planctomycetaceae bacterium]